MIDPQKFTGAWKARWTILSSKRNLQKLRKSSRSLTFKNNATKIDSSNVHTSIGDEERKVLSVNDSVKSSNSGIRWPIQ